MAVSYKMIGQRIRAAREKMGITQEEAAHRLAMSVGHYGKLERGDRKPSLDMLNNIGQMYNEPLLSFLVNVESGGSATEHAGAEHKERALQFDLLTRGCSDETVQLMLDLCVTVAARCK